MNARQRSRWMTRRTSTACSIPGIAARFRSSVRTRSVRSRTSRWALALRASRSARSSLSLNSLDRAGIALLFVVAAALLALAWVARQETAEWDRWLLVSGVLAAVSGVLVFLLPEYIYGYQINGIIHRSLITAVALLGVEPPGVRARRCTT